MAKKFHYFKKNRIKIEPHLAEYDEEEGCYVYRIAFPRAHAVILKPSFCCPSILEPEQDLNVYMLINEGLADSYDFKQKVETAFGPISMVFIRRINLQLRYNEWENVKQQPAFSSKDIKITNKQLFDWDYFNEHWPIYSTKPIKIEKENLTLYDNNQNIVGFIPQKTIKHYIKDGLNYYVKLTIKQHPFISDGDNGKLYNLNWMSLQDNDLPHPEQSPIAPNEERQDRLMRHAYTKFGLEYKYGYKIGSEPFNFTPDEDIPLISYHPIYVANKPKLGVGHLTDIHISSRQELFKKSKLQVIKGADEKVSPPIGSMVHSSLDSTKDLLDQMGSNPDVDLLFLTGDLVDYCKNLDLNKLQDANLDNHLLTWELMQLNKFSKSTINNSKVKTDFLSSHTSGIDMIIIYSLIKYYYDTYQKPIFITSGNHDSYTLPYGISPRLTSLMDNNLKDEMKVGFVPNIAITDHSDYDLTIGMDLLNEYKADRRTIKKVNEFIPVDHNLGFYESILMYGPGYSKILKANNFNKNIADLFYHLFNPVTDYTFRYKSQVFTGLDWGEDESIAKAVISKTSPLPLASESLTDAQLLILESAQNMTMANKCDNLLFWHATIINYDLAVSAVCPNNTTRVITHDPNNIEIKSKYDIGTFSRNKAKFINNFFATNVFSHILSGHSHRNGLYQNIGYKASFSIPMHTLYEAKPLKYDVYTRGFAYEEDKATCLDTIYNTPVYANLPQHPIRRFCHEHTKTIVTGSAGPIAVKNIYGELCNTGIAPPCGSTLTYQDGKETYTCITAKNKSAKPRFAALLDGIDITKEKVFTTFDYDIRNNCFIVDVNPGLNCWNGIRLVPVDFVEGVEVYVNSGSNSKVYKLTVKNKTVKETKGKLYLEYMLNDDDIIFSSIKDKEKNKSKKKMIYFVSVILKNCKYLDIYNFEDRWNYLACISSTKNSTISNGRIMCFKRDKEYGEIPDFEVYD